MKNKKIGKIVLSVLTSMSMLSSYSAMAFAETTNQGVAHEYDLVKLDRNGDLIVNGGFNNNGASWLKTGTGTFGNDNGNYYGKLPSNSNNAAVYQNVSLKKNTEYVVKGKVKISNENGQVFLAVKNSNLSAGLKDNNGQIIETTITSSKENANKYQDVEYTFNSGDNTSGAIAFIKWTERNGNQDIINEEVWIDDVSVKAVNETTEDDNYEMVWADDFNENQLDTSNWDYELGSIRGVEQEHYVNDPENVYVKDGQLVLQVTDRDKEDQYKNPRGNRQVIYNSGSIRTHGKKEFLYGRIEMKAKLPKGKGAFPAFWTLGSDFTLDGRISSEQGAPWPVCGEIDIMEMIGAADSDLNGKSNRKVYQTVHAGSTQDVDHSRSVSTYTLPEGIFNDDYHIFGINWSKNKLEFYVDSTIVGSIDYSNNEEYKRCFNRPQYIQLNLATGGNWAGDAGDNLAGQKYEVDYVYYGQNAQQKADSKEYYENAIKISGEHDVTMTEGETPDLLEGVTSDQDSILDYSIDNEYSFKSKGGLTSVDLVCSGKNDTARLKNLKPGKYNLYYTARSSTDATKPSTRRAVILTIEERTFEKDLDKSGLKLNGFIGDTLDTIQLPDGWVFENPKEIITEETNEVAVKCVELNKVQTAKINVQERAKIIAGENGIYDSKDSNPLKITINVSKEDILKVFVDGEELDSKYYTVENIAQSINGTANVTLSEEYLKTLDNGEHTIKITSTLGDVETSFTVNNTKDDNPNQKPDTGKDDNTNQKPDTGKDDNTNQKPSTDKKDEVNDKTNNVTTNIKNNTTQKTPKTGDQTPIELLTICGLVSLIAIVVLKKKKVND